MTGTQIAVLARSAKELLRHVFHKMHAHVVLDWMRSRHAINGRILTAASRRDRFTAIYADGLWKRNAEDVPGSGEGSSLVATATLRSELPRMLDRLGVQTLVDLGCGDFTWMRTLTLSQSYIGVDLVPSVIQSNQRNFADAKRSFFCLDVAEDGLPQGDAILCREVLFHLSFADIGAVLRNCGRAPRRYFLATTDSSTLVNADIRSGDFRRLNLQRHPFLFPEPEHTVQDEGVEKGRVIGIWKWESIASAVERL